MALFRKAPRAAPTSSLSVTETAPCEKSLRLRVALEAIAPLRAAVVDEFQKAAKPPGFRKGKAPTELVERQYAKEVQDETLQRATKQALEQAVKAHDLKPVGPFAVTAMTFSETEGLRIEATVEVEPSFSLGQYKGIPLHRHPVEVTPEEVDRALASLAESMARLVPDEQGGTKTRQVPAVDAEFAKDLGFKDLQMLRAHVEAKVREQKRLAQSAALEAALCEELIRRHPFEVPAKLVSHQTDRLTRDFKVRLLLSGMPEPQVNEEAGKFVTQLRTSAERHVKLAFILGRIAARESVTVTQDELVKRLWQLAQRWKQDPVEVRKIFDAQGLWSSVVSSIRQEKTTALLMSAASINNGGVA